MGLEKCSWRKLVNSSKKSIKFTNLFHAFALLAPLEAQINLFYNQHLDVDLSEQMVSDCVGKFVQIVSYNDL